MGSLVSRLVPALLLAAAVPKAMAEEVSMREISVAVPDEMVLSYRFPGPLKSAHITLKSGKGGVEALGILFGNGKRVEIPPAVLRCFKNTRAQESFFLFLPPDQQYPAAHDHWWSAIAVPFGEAAGAPASGMFPYVQFVISDWKLSDVVVQRSAEKSEKISLPVAQCPVP